MLVATISEGGMAIGAFDGDRLVGSVYGFATSAARRAPLALPGRRSRLPPHAALGSRSSISSASGAWPTGARRCVGRSIRCSSATPTSTCARSARSACGTTPNLYGPMGGINGGLPSDRLVVEWDLVGPALRGHGVGRRRRSAGHRRRDRRGGARCAARPRRAARCDAAAAGRRLAGRPTSTAPPAPTRSVADLWLRSVDHGLGEVGKDLADLGCQPVAVRAVEVAKVGAIPSPIGVGGRHPIVVEIDRLRSPRPIRDRGRTAVSIDRSSTSLRARCGVER